METVRITFHLPIDAMKSAMYGLAGISYSYGFCRSWTLPMWSTEHKKNDTPFRIILACTMGVVYVVPPFCLVKYYELGCRIHDQTHGIPPHSDHWTEWGFYHPRVF